MANSAPATSTAKGEQAPAALMTIGTRLQGARQRAGLTQQQVADAIKLVPDAEGRTRDLTRAAYAQWEVGLTTPDVERLRAAAEVLGVTPAYLAFGYADGERPDDAVWLKELGADLIEAAGSRWAVPRDVFDRLSASGAELRVARVPEDIAGTELAKGSIAILDLRARSVGSPGIYAFATEGRLRIVAMAPRPSSASCIVVRSGAVTFEESADHLDIRGRVVSAVIDVH